MEEKWKTLSKVISHIFWAAHKFLYKYKFLHKQSRSLRAMVYVQLRLKMQLVSHTFPLVLS